MTVRIATIWVFISLQGCDLSNGMHSIMGHWRPEMMQNKMMKGEGGLNKASHGLSVPLTTPGYELCWWPHVFMSSVAQFCPTSLQPPWTVALQAPMSMGFPGQNYWSGLPFPSPRDLSEPGIKHISLSLEGTEAPGKPRIIIGMWNWKQYQRHHCISKLF